MTTGSSSSNTHTPPTKAQQAQAVVLPSIQEMFPGTSFFHFHPSWIAGCGCAPAAFRFSPRHLAQSTVPLPVLPGPPVLAFHFPPIACSAAVLILIVI
jgi:hypothetical protein